MITILIQDVFFLILLVSLSIPLGLYISKVMAGEKTVLSFALSPLENGFYRLIGIQNDIEMTAKTYTLSVLFFSLTGFLFLFVFQLIQGLLPLNPQHLGSIDWTLAFNTAASFVSNTNWQAYSGETTMSYLTQMLGLTVQNFVSAGTGIAVCFVLIRGFANKSKKSIGCFWHDLTRSILYILLPLSVILSLILVSQGVVQTFRPYALITTLESTTKVLIPLGPAASQIAIKMLGTNGGGFFGANSAFPFENPTAFSDLLQMLSILLIPAALIVSFGRSVHDMKQGRTIYIVMIILFVASLIGVTVSEQLGGISSAYIINSGNLEGKEILHSIGSSSLWSTSTTAASNGSVNALLDSFTPLGGLILMFLMQLGEIVFGGVGSGLYGMVAFVILTVFIAGLMVGRTPEYLCKKIEPFEIKMVCIIILTPLILTLAGTSIALMMPQINEWLLNKGPHGFSEVLYAFSSMGNNNGSAFSGFYANTAFSNLLGGIIMLITRFVPMAAVIYLSGHLSERKTVSVSEGTLSTSNLMFVNLLIFVILIVGALSFLPALSLGPIAEFMTHVK